MTIAKRKMIDLYDTRGNLIGKIDYDSLQPDRDGNECGNCYVDDHIISLGWLQDVTTPCGNTSARIAYRVSPNYQGDEQGNLDALNWRSKAYRVDLRANATLIAAAPEMYATLKDVRSFLRRAGCDTRLIDAALARAEGRAKNHQEGASLVW